MKVLGLRLDRHFVLLFFLGIACGAFTLLQRNQIWLTERLWAADWANLSVFLLGPIAFGVGYFDAREFHLSGIAQLVTACVRPRLAMVRAVARTYVPLALSHLAILGLAVGLSSLRHGGSLRLADSPAAFAMLLLYCAAGWYVGRYLSALFVAPLLVLVAFGAQLVAFREGLKPFIQVGGATSSLVGLQTDVVHVFLQTTALISLAALVILRVSLLAQRKRPHLMRLVSFALVALTIWAGGYLVTTGSTRFELVRNPTLTCADADGLQVCVEPDYAGKLASAVRIALHVKSRLAEASIAAPTRYEQGLIGRESSLPTGTSNLSSTGDVFTGPDFAREVVYTSILGCPDPRAASRDEQFSVPAAILQWWLLAAIDPASAGDTADLIPLTFRELAPEQQAAWVSQAAAAMSECRAPTPL